MHQELEFKFGVEDQGAFERLARQLGLAPLQQHPLVQQTNHFFDTSEHLLHGQQMILRLREEGERKTLTFKGNQESLAADGSVTRRTELECGLDSAVAQAVLEGRRSPLTCLKEGLDAEGRRKLTRLTDLLGDRELCCIGSFTNRRTRLPAAPFQVAGVDFELAFELDRCSIVPGADDFEIEVEVHKDVDLAALRTRLHSLLEDAGIRWRSLPSKSQRLYAHLESGG